MLFDDEMINKELENELLEAIKKHIDNGEDMSKIVCTLTDLLSTATEEIFDEYVLVDKEESLEKPSKVDDIE